MQISDRSWEGDLLEGNTLKLLGYSQLPPPSVGNACILQGTIPDPIGNESDIASVSFMLQGSPVVEILEGECVFQRRIAAGTFGIAPVGAPHKYRTQGEHTSLNLAIQDDSIQEFARSEFEFSGSRVDLIACIGCREPVEVFPLGLALSKLIRAPKKGSALYAQALWTQILLQILWHHSSLPSEVFELEAEALSQTRIQDVTDYMRETLADDISLSDLAKQAGLSPGYFLRSFKSATGKTPIQYRLDLRLERACGLLTGTAMPIADIALSLGFSSHSQFCSAFRRRMGVSPSAYRRANQ